MPETENNKQKFEKQKQNLRKVQGKKGVKRGVFKESKNMAKKIKNSVSVCDKSQQE